MKKTKAIQILEDLGLEFETLSFKAKEFTAEEVAVKQNLPLNQVFKTLLTVSDNAGYVFAVVPGDRELNLKKLAATIGEKKAEMVDLKDLTRLTGYQKGGCSPLGAKRNIPVIIDECAQDHPFILVSAGLRGLQLKISPNLLAQAASAKFAELS
jgi:Cys-tRNA(Pro)/Cys-tRNA(Cys) deacylase